MGNKQGTSKAGSVRGIMLSCSWPRCYHFSVGSSFREKRSGKSNEFNNTLPRPSLALGKWGSIWSRSIWKHSLDNLYSLINSSSEYTVKGFCRSVITLLGNLASSARSAWRRCNTGRMPAWKKIFLTLLTFKIQYKNYKLKCHIVFASAISIEKKMHK